LAGSQTGAGRQKQIAIRQQAPSLDHGPPPNSHALGDDPDLNTLANAAEQLFARDD
jgi:hypothetical protein